MIDFWTLPSFHRSVNPVSQLRWADLNLNFQEKKNENEIIPKSDASKLLFQSSNLDSNKTENGKSMLISMKFYSESLIIFLLLHQQVTKYQIPNCFDMSFFVDAIQKRKIENRQLIFELWQYNKREKQARKGFRTIRARRYLRYIQTILSLIKLQDFWFFRSEN